MDYGSDGGSGGGKSRGGGTDQKNGSREEGAVGMRWKRGKGAELQQLHQAETEEREEYVGIIIGVCAPV